MEAEKIISLAPEKMRGMLLSVLGYNSSFLLSKEQEKLLEKIIFAMSIVDRKYFYVRNAHKIRISEQPENSNINENFLDEGEEAYDDNALPIGEGQTISQPSTVARMLLLGELQEGDDILEIGTGSGWNASLISFLVYPGNVLSVERFVSLKEKAEDNLANLRNYLKQKKPQDIKKIEKINFYAENIFERKKAWKRKYDKIIITAGISQGEEEKIEFLALELLKQKGILICPYISGPLLIYKKNGKLKRFLTKEEYVFVPLLE